MLITFGQNSFVYCEILANISLPDRSTAGVPGEVVILFPNGMDGQQQLGDITLTSEARDLSWCFKDVSLEVTHEFNRAKVVKLKYDTCIFSPKYGRR